MLAEQGWDGALRPAASDYLLVVDTNMGFNKVNGLVQGSIDYQVLINADGTAEATLTVRHVNPSVGEAACDHRPHYGADYEEMMNRCYWDYLRVYAPAGSQLQSATVHPVEADLLISGQPQSGEVEVLPEEKGKAVFASFFVLPRGQETETRFVYQLPPPVVERHEQGWRYRLLVQKQAGTRAVPLRVSLVLPPGARVEAAEPPAQGAEPDRLVFDTSLVTDQAFEVSFQYDRD